RAVLSEWLVIRLLSDPKGLGILSSIGWFSEVREVLGSLPSSSLVLVGKISSGPGVKLLVHPRNYGSDTGSTAASWFPETGSSRRSGRSFGSAGGCGK